MEFRKTKLTILSILLLSLASLIYAACLQDFYKPHPMLEQEDTPTTPNITWDPESGHFEPDDCGGKIGDVVCNHTLNDSNEDEWQLYDHYGDIVVLDFSTMWCFPCQQSATELQLLQDFYEDHDVQFVTILLQDFQGQIPNPGALEQWADAFRLDTVPVLADDGTLNDPTEERGFNINALPTIVIINRERVIINKMDGWNLFRLLDQLDVLTSI